MTQDLKEGADDDDLGSLVTMTRKWTHITALARIHRRYDVTAAEWAMRGKRRRWSGHDFWQLGPVSVFSRRGETL